MAKKGNRQTLLLACSICNQQTYITQKNVVNSKDKMSLSKYCRHCRKHTPHFESKL